MTIQDYLRVLREQWLVVVVAITFGIASAASIFFIKPLQYTAKLTMYVSAQGGDTTQAAFQGAQLSEDRVTSYTALVTGTRISTDVINQLGLPETPDELAKKIIATSALNSVIIEVGLTDPSPERAAQLANAVGQAMTSLVAELERPIQVGGAPAVALRVVQPAAIPDKPSSIGLPTMLGLGAVAGLLLGIGGALARNALDNSVNSLSQLRTLSQAPNLGSIFYDPTTPRKPLTVHQDPQSPRSEAYRQIRTNLQFIDVDRPQKIVAISSSMPGEGKTTTLANLAIATASAGHRVLVIDADLRRPKIADLFGLERTAGLTSVLSGRVRVEDVIQPWGGGVLDIIASGQLPPNPSELLASHHMASLLDTLRKQYDYVLIDTPPLIPVTDAAAIAPACDGVILICRAKKTTRGQVSAATEALSSVSVKVLGTVFSMIPSNGTMGNYASYNNLYYSRPTGPDGVGQGTSRMESLSTASIPASKWRNESR